MPDETVPSLRDTIESAVSTVESTTNEAPTPSQSASLTPEPPSSDPAEKSQTSPASETSPPPKEEEKKPYLEQKDATTEKLPEGTDKIGKTETKSEEAARARVDRPPASWKGDARSEWNKLPLPVRQEVLRRERDIDGQLRQYAGLKGFSDEYARMIQPYLPRMQNVGVNPIQAAQRLFEADRILSSSSKVDRAQYLAKIIQDYDIDIPTLDSVLSGRVTQQNDPQTVIRREIEQALQPVFGFMQQQQQQHRSLEQQQQQKADEMVGNMATDPNFPYYEDLREDMADMIDLAAARGLALTLPQAYARAAAAHPEIGPLVVGEMHKQQLQRTTQEAQRAKAASVSVGGAPTGTPPNSVDPTDLRATLEHSIAVNSRRM